VADDRIVAITVMANSPSWGLMERLGMRRNPMLDFDHPNFAPGDPLRPHIAYEITRSTVTENA
jgi:RimJ/RimL family protein N-acetyltransferase